MNLDFLVAALRDFGFELHTAADGASGLGLAREKRPDLVLLDIVMPEMDGLAVCACLKADPATRDVPVIILSAVMDTEDKLQAFQLGAVDFINKTVDHREVTARVLLHLRQDRLRRSLELRLSALERKGLPVVVDHAAQPDQTMTSIARGVERVARYLLENLRESPTLDQLARLACSNRRTLNEEFRAVFQLSVFRWLREQRLREAARLLRSTELRIQQVADAVGFTSHAGLIKAFRERFGVSPSEYRQNQRR